jgi:glycerol-3-phosphate dehydrogenase (NAD(P)+)
MGDLIATCWSHLGRNRRAGGLIARGASPEEAISEIGTVEGLTTALVLRNLANRVGVEMPITSAVCDILEGKSLDDLISGLMGRRPTAE